MSTTNDPTSSDLIKAFGPSIWTVEGPTVDFMGCPYPTRMVLIELQQQNVDKKNAVWIWSPVKLTMELQEELKTKQFYDNIAYIVSPNKIHHIFLQEWQEAFPNAKVYAPPGLKGRKVVEHVTFESNILNHDDQPPLPFEDDIDYVVFKGSCFMQEVVFYHKVSQTVIIADLIQRFLEKDIHGITGALLKLDGLVGPNGGTPKDFRCTFLLGKDQARKARDIIVEKWEPKHLIIAHGDCVSDGTATMVVDKAFGWLGDTCLCA